MRYALSLLPALMLAGTMGVASSPAAETTYSFEQRRDTSDLARVKAQLEVTGTLETRSGSQQKTSHVKVSASMAYDENRLPDKEHHYLSLRHYDRAEASIRVDQGEFRPRLRPGRKFVAVNVRDERATLYSPSGPLTREELDLIDIPGNTAVLPLLFANEPLPVGGTWKINDDVLAMLLCIDAISASDVQCELRQVTPQRIALVQMAGSVHGAVHGVATEIELKGRLNYDLRARRISELEWTINEERGISHVGPGLKVTCRLQINMDGIASSPQLTEDRVARWAEGTPPRDPLLWFHWQSTGYQLLHSRLWHVVDERPHLVVLRLMERGELVAQCNVSPGNIPPGSPEPKAQKADGKAPKAAKPNTLEEYAGQVRKALDKNLGKIVSSKQGTTAAGLTYYCVVAEGEVQDVPIRWVYYLLSDDRGRHAGLVFTLEQKLAAKFGTAGERLVDQFRFEGASRASAPFKKTKAAGPK